MIMGDDKDAIPEEYWPRCSWCGRLLPDCSVSHKTAFGECTICPVCCSMVGELVKRWAPGYVEEVLSLFKDRDEPPYFETLGHEDLLKIAREKMKEAKTT